MHRVALLLTALSLLVAPASASAACADSDLIPDAGNLDRVAAATLCLHNEERAAHGLAPLSWSAQLAEAAQAHSDDMVLRRFFDHTNLDGLSPFRRIRATGYDYTWAGENIAWGAGGDRPTPAAAMRGWMDSPGHRENILRPQFRHIGIGIAPAAPVLLSFREAATYTANFGDTRAEIDDAPPGTVPTAPIGRAPEPTGPLPPASGQTPAPETQTKLQACLDRARHALTRKKRKKLRKRCHSRHGAHRRR